MCRGGVWAWLEMKKISCSRGLQKKFFSADSVSLHLFCSCASALFFPYWQYISPFPQALNIYFLSILWGFSKMGICTCCHFQAKKKDFRASHFFLPFFAWKMRYFAIHCHFVTCGMKRNSWAVSKHSGNSWFVALLRRTYWLSQFSCLKSSTTTFGYRSFAFLYFC